MKDDLIPTINTEFTVEKFEDEILLFSKAEEKAVYLNDSAHIVWLLCKENMSVGQMIQYLEKIYPEQKAQIKDGVVAALEMLMSNDVIGLENE